MCAFRSCLPIFIINIVKRCDPQHAASDLTWLLLLVWLAENVCSRRDNEEQVKITPSGRGNCLRDVIKIMKMHLCGNVRAVVYTWRHNGRRG